MTSLLEMIRPLRRVLLAAMFLPAVGCHRETLVDRGSTTRPVVLAARVGRGRLAREYSFQAELRPWFSVDLQARVAGYVKRLSVDLGDRVKAGQLLAELDVPLLHEDRLRAEAMVSRSEGELARAGALYDEARLVSGRLSGVAAAHPQLLAGQEVDSAVAREKAAAASLAAARSQLEVSKADVKRLQAMEADTKICAPFDGVIARLDASPGDLVQGGPSPSGQARPLLRIVRDDLLRCAFAVSVGQIDAVHVGSPVSIHMEQRTVAARVIRVSGEVTTAGRSMMVEADVANADGLLVPGAYATAVVTGQERTNALFVPIEAVKRSAGSASVLRVAADGQVTAQPIRLGIETPVRIEVIEGLQEGDVVVTGGASRIRSGKPVETRFAATEKTP